MSDLDHLYVRFRGRTLGPFTRDQSKEMIRRGQITRLHELSADGISWSKAESFSDLFPRQTTTSAKEEQRSEIRTPAQSQTPVVEVVTWYAHINNTNSGPFPDNAVRSMIGSGQISRDTLLWKEGMSEWKPAAECFPGLFPANTAIQNRASHLATQVNQTGEPETTNLSPVFLAFLRGHGWALFLAILGICLCGGWLAWGVTMLSFALGNNDKIERTSGIVFAAILIASSSAFLLCAILLLRFCSSLTMLKYTRSAESLRLAGNRLTAFFQALGIVAICVLTFYGFAWLLIFYVAAP